ncbi:MAG: aldo/keto reductase [Acidobacteriota bacterium]|nr:aldo/keto reductase [Acidobacteriota bacterium]
MEYRVLGKTGLRVSVLGFGAAPLGNDYGTIDPGEGERAVHSAIDRGINLFDTSPYYGRTLSEERLGAALVGRREQIVLSTKLGRYDKNQFDFSAKRVQSSIDESLGRLQTDYVDLLIAHDIEFGDRERIISETIPAMRKVQESGKARFIGISGLPLKILADVAERARVDFVLTYCRYNLLNRDLDRWLTPVVEKHNLGLIGAAAVHMGILTKQGPPPWHPAQAEVKEAGARVVALCESRGVDPVVVAIRFTANHPLIASTLVGMPRRAEVEDNVAALGNAIDQELLDEIDEIVAPVRDTIWPSGLPENDD